MANSYWVAVDSSPIPPSTRCSVVDGAILHFTDSQLSIRNVYEKNSQSHEYRLDNEELYVNDTLWATTYAKYSDSIILDIIDIARVKFVRLGNEHTEIQKPALWKHKHWILSYNDFKRELILTDYPYFDDLEDKLCIQKNLQEGRFMDIIDKWDVVTINNNQLFVKTFNQTDDELYRIKKYQGDSLVTLESLRNPDVQASLKKIKYISEVKKQEIQHHIQNYTWKIDKVIKLDTIKQMGKYWETELPQLISLKTKKMSFLFSDDLTYTKYESDNSIANGNWKLSDTGNEIILNDGLYPSDYIDLIVASADSLVIGNIQDFTPDNYDTMWGSFSIYYKAILKR
ncbi:hypothetical protein [Dokdonia ponticola]|uniref:hypothetical protein n=1 Tax=Dokdonia ponticola TaxID=2041041 RepID=UPI0036D32F18